MIQQYEITNWVKHNENERGCIKVVSAFWSQPNCIILSQFKLMVSQILVVNNFGWTLSNKKES